MIRRTLLLAPLLAALMPVAASAEEERRTDSAAYDLLFDPASQDALADTIAMAVQTMMNVNIGPLAQAVARIDPYSDAAYLPDDATLGEVTGRDDPYYGERLGDDVRDSAQAAGHLAASLAAFAPVLRDMTRDLAAQWEEGQSRRTRR